MVRALVLLLFVAAANAAEPQAPLQFRITEGRILNAFYQQGPVAAHVLLSDGTQPRLLVAFPAGNSGVGLWFENTQIGGGCHAWDSDFGANYAFAVEP